MESSPPGAKKIVFKNRLRPVEQEPVELLVEPAPAVEDIVVEPSQEVNYLFEGEIFDQFYRPLLQHGGEARLHELALEPLAAPAPTPLIAGVELEAKRQEMQTAAEALSHQIYNLAQKIRETDLDVYLSAFNVVLAPRPMKEIKEILDRANEFFSEHYYLPIRERGERPEIYHQIVKRVGHDSGERLALIVKGLDVETTARNLWDLYNGTDPEKAKHITEILLTCTERQVRALREEFLLIPYKGLARQLGELLRVSATPPEEPSAGRKTIGRNEVYEQKKQSALRSRDVARAIRYLLLGRSSEEIQLIKSFYQELDIDGLAKGASLEASIDKVLLQSDIDKLGSLLAGWSPAREADEIYRLLYPPTMGHGIEDQGSDPKDSVDRDYTQGLGPFLKRFRRCRILFDNDSVHYRTVFALDAVQERVAAVSVDRFLQTNEAMYQQYGCELDPSLFPSLAPFDARRRALQVRDRLEYSNDLFEIIYPIEFLDPRRALAVQKAYQSIFGESLADTICSKVLPANATPQMKSTFTATLKRYIDGQGRWPLNIDLLARYRGEEPEAEVWEYDFTCAAAEEEVAVALAEVLDGEEDEATLWTRVRELLWGRSSDELNRIERAFYELTDPSVPLLEVLTTTLAPEQSLLCEAYLAGVDVDEVVQTLHADPSAISTYPEFSVKVVTLLRQRFKELYGVELEVFIMNHFHALHDSRVAIEALRPLMLPEVYRFRRALHTLKRDRNTTIDLIRPFWGGSLVRVMAIESAFDAHFPTLRIHLKFAAARQALSPKEFAEAILSLEGIDTEIVTRLLECFDAVDIKGLQDILRRNKQNQRTIEEVYDLIYPDASFRKMIKDMKVDLDLISETLLHLEGYSAKDVAHELHQVVEQLLGQELADECLRILAVPTAQEPNPRIPEDINWMDEMLYQVALSYQREFGGNFIGACRGRGVPEEVLEGLLYRIYGTEVCGSARELFKVIEANRMGVPDGENSEERICSYLESRGVRHRDRLVRAYHAIWGNTPGFVSLINDVTTYFNDGSIKKKVVSLLLGLGN